MLTKHSTLTLILFFFIKTSSFYAQISETRQLVLDSFVSNIDKPALKNLDTLHKRIHFFGQNDEERVFMYFGLFPIHYTYDNDRKGDKKAKEYTTYYIAKTRKGVCRDFTKLFKELCDRSNIVCIEAHGRAETPFIFRIGEFFKYRFRLRKANHVWNIVKYNNQWHLMDPTWGTIKEEKKFYSYNDKGRKVKTGKAKIPDRTYYNSNPEKFYYKRNAIHPSFYLSKTIHTFKSQKKSKTNKYIIVDNNYNFSQELKKIEEDSMYLYSSAFNKSIYNYSNIGNSRNIYINNMFNLFEMKRTKLDKLTISDCENHLAMVKSINKYVTMNSNHGWPDKIEKLETEIEVYIAKLKKKKERIYSSSVKRN